MKTRTMFFSGFICGICVALCIYLPVYHMKAWQKNVHVQHQSGTVLVASQKRMTIGELQSYVFLFDSNLAGDVDEVRVSSDGRLLCIGICMRADGPNTQRQFVFSDLLLRRIEKDGSLIFVRTVPFQTASK